MLSMVQQKTTRERKQNFLPTGFWKMHKFLSRRHIRKSALAQAERVEHELGHMLLLGPKCGVLGDPLAKAMLVNLNGNE